MRQRSKLQKAQAYRRQVLGSLHLMKGLINSLSPTVPIDVKGDLALAWSAIMKAISEVEQTKTEDWLGYGK